MSTKRLFAKTNLALLGLALAWSSGMASPALAQPGGRSQSLPLQGKALPSVKVLDEDGQVFSTESLRGNYTVLVFGCLT